MVRTIEHVKQHSGKTHKRQKCRHRQDQRVAEHVRIFTAELFSCVLIPKRSEALACSTTPTQRSNAVNHTRKTIERYPTSDQRHHRSAVRQKIHSIRAGEQGDQPKLNRAEQKSVEAVMSLDDVAHARVRSGSCRPFPSESKTI